MPRTLSEQFLETIERAKRPLIILPEIADIDSFCAAFALANFLAKLEKPVEIAVSGGNAPRALSFLKSSAPLHGDLPNIRKLILHIATDSATLDSLSYSVEKTGIEVHITPRSGAFSPKDVHVDAKQYCYDLIISLGLVELGDAGDLLRRYADFFYETPIVNIDHKTANEHFGALNLVDIRAVAVSEMVYEIINAIDPSQVDEETATACLAGMMHKTRSFRSTNVTPKTLNLAGDLMAKGAKRDVIVEHLYQTRSVETLRLWGRALSRIKSHTESGLIWSLLTKQDFALAGADESSLKFIIEELLMNAPNAKAGAIFYEDGEKGVRVLLQAARPFDALLLGAPFTASGTREEAELRLRNIGIVEAERKVVDHIKKELVLEK